MDVCALAIGGLDPGGGAGIAADLRAFALAGAFGCAAIALVTVQSTVGLRASRALEAREVVAQAREVLLHQRVRAIKTGALGSVANVRAVARLLAQNPRIPAIVDPVILPTRGAARLLDADALSVMRKKLVPRAWLVTPNAWEAEALTGIRVKDEVDAAAAARALVALGARAALVKGGHLRGPRAIDVLAFRAGSAEPQRTGVYLVEARRLGAPKLHGAGCVLASLVAARVAVRPSSSPLAAVRWAKAVHATLIARARDVGGALRVL
jgi:hydroxymethylpyrimidine/phosphomethylpyrimidine kinase